ncbi:MAG TPA: uroporphyrinogen decarboxylase family protein [Candidatus Acidoferrales bacterium]|nr:uroporphyrinogen decarboxylase family protein [Candidatus Acidoferrales bacterium]
MTSKQRVIAAVGHREPDRVPIDFGSTSVTGLHASCVAALRDWFGLERRPVKIHEPGQMLGLIEEDLKQAMGLDVDGLFRRNTKFGFPVDNWKPWRTHQGLEVLVPGRFNTTADSNGDTLIYPEGDLAAPPSGRMPSNGYFFDAIVRQEPIDEEKLDPQDNLEDFSPISDDEIAWLKAGAEAAAASGRAVTASFGGTSFGDIALVPATFLKRPKGIRDITEWYMSTSSRRDYIHAVFSGQCEVALADLARIHAGIGGLVDIVFICGTDFGTQTGTFCSVATFRDLWLPYYRRVNDWIHAHTSWKTLKHSCGSVDRFIPGFIEAGFDILNPVQCSAANMDPEHLKAAYGDRVAFWGGGVDTQKVLPFGTPGEVRKQVIERCRIFSRGGGYVFNAIHNVQAETPTENIVAMIDAVREFNGAMTHV